VTAVLLVHALATFAMVGIIWMVQVVHYPLFALVGGASFAAYEAAHSARMGALLLVPWGVEGFSGLALLALVPPGVPRWLVLADLALLGVTVLVTVAVSVRQHQALSAGFDPDAHRVLVATNWLRTAAWTGCGALSAALLWQALP